MNAKSKSSSPTWVDPDDAPEITDEWIAQADLYHGDKLIRRGVGRPAGSTKTPTTLRLDDDVLASFKAMGKGWQTRINEILRDYLKSHT